MGGKLRTASFLAVLIFAFGCAEEKKDKEPDERPAQKKPTFTLAKTPVFNSDSAYQYIDKQVAFGPRVPNTGPHKLCGKWLEAKLKSFGMTVNVQKAEVTAYNGQILKISNIMSQYKPNAPRRILLCAHWDSRPYADRDDENIRQAIDGANDGASGVGVILEIARAIATDSGQLDMGVDFVFFDAEDYGKPQGSMLGNSGNSWCLGSQHWARNIPLNGYKPDFGILLDMVGAENAVFPKEGVSMYYAPQIVNRVWKIAGAMGHSDYFKPFRGSEITDDHRYLNEIAAIPTVDIIHYDMGRNDFGTFHHTHADNMDVISKPTLKVVGDVVLQVLYQE
jgi:glutaminyl-peptide cyclotransferase